MAVMIFLVGILLEFGVAKTQTNSKIPSLDDAFTPILQIESSQSGVSVPQPNALISKNNKPSVPRGVDNNFWRTNYDNKKSDSYEIYLATVLSQVI